MRPKKSNDGRRLRAGARHGPSRFKRRAKAEYNKFGVRRRARLGTEQDAQTIDALTWTIRQPKGLLDVEQTRTSDSAVSLLRTCARRGQIFRSTCWNDIGCSAPKRVKCSLPSGPQARTARGPASMRRCVMRLVARRKFRILHRTISLFTSVRRLPRRAVATARSSGDCKLPATST